MAATFAAVAVLGAILVPSAQAEETFQKRAWVGPYQEGKQSALQSITEVEGEGFEYEACVDVKLVDGGYTSAFCATKNRVAILDFPTDGRGRVWNAKGYNNEIWGWLY